MSRFLLPVFALLWGGVLAATSPADVDRAANAVAVNLNGVIRPCPSPFQLLGTANRRCVAADGSSVLTRQLLSTSGLNLYGGWRSDDDPAYVYNWIQMPSGYVKVMVAPFPNRPGSALVFLDVTASSAVTAPAFRRTLRLSTPRMNGADVIALQNRLMDVSKVARGAGGDGWFGPVTEANVIAFQSTNGLAPSGVVDRATWAKLFSSTARFFDPKLAKAIAERNKVAK